MLQGIQKNYTYVSIFICRQFLIIYFYRLIQLLDRYNNNYMYKYNIHTGELINIFCLY